MKKLIIGLFSALLMGGGLVGLSTAPAQADCPYTGCVKTKTSVSTPGAVKKGGRATICVKVTTAGKGQPKGTVSVKVTRKGGGYKFSDSSGYKGRTCFKTSKLKKPGKYAVSAKFDGRGAFKNSSDSGSFKVKKR